MFRAQWTPYRLHFREVAITSRQKMRFKDTYFVRIWEDSAPGIFGVGEIPLFKGLSSEDNLDFGPSLKRVCNEISSVKSLSEITLPKISSIHFGIEQAILDLQYGGKRIYYDSPWTNGELGQQINGLVWMGDRHTMAARIKQKLDTGFQCVKLKIGGIDFEEELGLLRSIRKEFNSNEIELRLDANGAFLPSEALEKLKKLSEYDIHSLEQPIKAGLWEEMANICALSPIPIALDEELIGFHSYEDKKNILQTINPQYIILKPALCGGFSQAEEWINVASKNGIGWWATSALESDIGLDGIAQWVSTLKPTMPQGLGTGQLYTNNIQSKLHLEGQFLWREPNKKISLPNLQWRN